MSPENPAGAQVAGDLLSGFDGVNVDALVPPHERRPVRGDPGGAQWLAIYLAASTESMWTLLFHPTNEDLSWGPRRGHTWLAIYLAASTESMWTLLLAASEVAWIVTLSP